MFIKAANTRANQEPSGATERALAGVRARGSEQLLKTKGSSALCKD